MKTNPHYLPDTWFFPIDYSFCKVELCISAFLFVTAAATSTVGQDRLGGQTDRQQTLATDREKLESSS